MNVNAINAKPVSSMINTMLSGASTGFSLCRLYFISEPAINAITIGQH